MLTDLLARLVQVQLGTWASVNALDNGLHDLYSSRPSPRPLKPRNLGITSRNTDSQAHTRRNGTHARTSEEPEGALQHVPTPHTSHEPVDRVNTEER
jgi:hypothetical protein